MNLSLATTACPHLDLSAALDFIKCAGYPGIELFRLRTDSAPALQSASLKMVRAWIADADIALTGLNVRNLTGRRSDTDTLDPKYNLDQVEWDLHLARALGLDAVNLRLEPRSNADSAKSIQLLQELRQRVPDIAVNVACGRGSTLDTHEGYARILDGCDANVRILVDTAALIEAELDVIQLIETAGPRIGLVHLCDTDGQSPVPMGQGTLPLKVLIKSLATVGYAQAMVINPDRVVPIAASPDEFLDTAIDARRHVENALAAIW